MVGSIVHRLNPEHYGLVKLLEKIMLELKKYLSKTKIHLYFQKDDQFPQIL